MHGESVRSLITFNGLANLPNPTLRFNQCCLMATATGRCNDGRLVKQQQHHQQKHLFLLCNMKSFVQFSGKLARQLIERISIGSNADNEVFSRHHRPKNGGNCVLGYLYSRGVCIACTQLLKCDYKFVLFKRTHRRNQAKFGCVLLQLASNWSVHAW